ncbi:MAG: tetratricopeptide repeat protein [Nitrosomonadales bacterium]|nr:tetratricopeptide repeat protein [Nitrosomonadales bacterium]
MSYRAKLLDYFRQRDRGWLLSLFAAVCLVYLPFLGNPFVFDDLNFFSGAVPEIYAHSWFHFDLRWLPYASLGWTAAIFSDAVPHFFHLGNALLHAANVVLLFYLLRQLAGMVIAGHEKSSAVIWGAWFGALFFAIHPVAVYAVGYVIQRSILLATLFSLVMQLAYVRGLLTGQKRWLALAVAAYFLAVFSKEHSVMMLGVLAATTILLRKGDGEAVGHPAASPLRGLREKNQTDTRMLWLVWGAFIAVGLLVVLRAKGVFGTPYEAMAASLFEQQGVVESTPMLHLLSVLTQAGLFFKYLLLWWLPNPAWMSVDMREHFISSWSAWQGWLGIIGFMVYGALAGWLMLRPRWAGLAGLALLYPWLQFVVEFSSIRVQEPFVLYRSYLWLPGMMLFFPLLLTKLPGRRTLLGLGLATLLFLPLAWDRLWTFADNYRLWNDAAQLLHSEQEPGADRIFYNRGQAEAAMHKWEDAIADFQRVVAVSPQLAPVRYELGMTYVNVGNYQKAREQFDVEIALAPDEGRAYFGKGLALMGLHEKEQASIQLQRGCKLGIWEACLVAGNPQQEKK